MRLLDDLACRCLGICRRRSRRWIVALPVAAALIGVYLATSRQTQTAAEYSITVNAGSARGTISRLLMGSNFQWFNGENVLIDKQRPECGVRPDMIGLTTALRVSMLRFPGGATSETYHWRDAVGPVGQRKRLVLSPWRADFPYFGTDEFMAFCKAVGCQEKMITVNYCTGSPQEAANWVEYCNAPAPQTYSQSWTITSYEGDAKAPPGYFAWLRQKLGHARPYGVKYWELGNEVYCRDEVGPNLTPEKYGADFIEFAQAMKAVDPTIKIGAVSTHLDPWEDWNERVLRIAAGSIDFMSPHYGSCLFTLTWDKYYSNSTTSRRVYFPQSGTYTFAATMRATIMTEGLPANEVGVPAKMRFSIDGQSKCVWDVIGLQKQEYACSVTAGYHDLAVSFINDYCAPDGRGRDAFLYGVTMRSASVPERNIWYPDDAEQQLLFNDGKAIRERIASIKSLIERYSPQKEIAILVTEGCLACDEGQVSKGYPKEEIRHGLRLKGALWQATAMNALIREQTPAFCEWLLLDGGNYGLVREPQRTSDGLPLVTPTYFAIQMYSRLAGSTLLDTTVVSPTYVWPDDIHPPPVHDGNWFGRSCPRPDLVPHLDAIAALSPGGKYLNIMVTNRSNESATTRIQITGFRPQPVADVRTLCAWTVIPRPDRIVGNVCPEMEAYCETKTQGNEVTQPDDVSVRWTRISKVTPAFTYTFRPFSVTLITLRQRR